MSPAQKLEMEVLRMNKLFYPALFHRAEEGGFWVSFPDFLSCFIRHCFTEQRKEDSGYLFRIFLNVLRKVRI